MPKKEKLDQRGAPGQDEHDRPPGCWRFLSTFTLIVLVILGLAFGACMIEFAKL